MMESMSSMRGNSLNTILESVFLSFAKSGSCLLLRCLCTTRDRRHTSRNQPGGPSLFSSWSTLMYVFHVPTSSARCVNSSGLSLTVTSGHLSATLGVRILNFSMPWLKYPTSRARWLSIFMNSLSPCVMPFPALLTEVCHNVLCEAISIFLLVRQQLQRINQISAKALRCCTCTEDLGLIGTFTCLYHQEACMM